jgi:hypothetical protein
MDPAGSAPTERQRPRHQRSSMHRWSDRQRDPIRSPRFLIRLLALVSMVRIRFQDSDPVVRHR